VTAQADTPARPASRGLLLPLKDVRSDVVVVIGDVQHEQFHENNQPAVLICSGETIENGVSTLPATALEYWKRARGNIRR